MYSNYRVVKRLPHTVVWEKFGVKKFFRTPRTTKIKHMKILLPQRNRVVYNGL